MSDAEGDQEVLKLRKLKKRLLHRATELKNKIQELEDGAESSTVRNLNDFTIPRNKFEDLLPQSPQKSVEVSKRCLAVCAFMSGFKFDSVDKKWVSGHNYRYTANVISKVLQFAMKVTVDTTNKDKIPTILDIKFDFVDVRACYLLEITPWVDRFTEAKDMSNFFSAVSDYTELHLARTKIMKSFHARNISTIEECNSNNGGLIITLHSKDDVDFKYFEIQWILRFVENLWRVDNFFIIKSISAGDDFLAANNELLQGFCASRISVTELIELWDKLCAVIEHDETSQLASQSSLPI